MFIVLRFGCVIGTVVFGVIAILWFGVICCGYGGLVVGLFWLLALR